MRREKGAIVAVALSRPIMRLIEDNIKDLNHQKTKAVKKINKLIEARNKEVFEAQDAIAKMESVIEGLALKNQNQKEQSDREIAKLQEEIGKLLNSIKDKENELTDFQNKKKSYETELRQRAKEKAEKPTIKMTITDDKTKIADLEQRLEEAETRALFFDNSLQNERLQLEHAKKEIQREKERHETTKKNAEADLKAEKAEHALTRDK
jgi:chromosome segregation ATPase